MDATVADPVIGRLIDGRYTAQERLAVGGMATVYIAHDNRLDRMVALKVMHPNLMHDQDSVIRFHREARAVAALETPRVVSVFDFGQARTPAGVLNYLVMELVRGRSLRQYLGRKGRLAPDEAMDVILAVAEALAAAHSREIIHRDIKPENILLGDDGQVKVADFGLARPIGQPTAKLTDGVVMGTVGYLAPEQVTHGNADYRSDVYAAGVVLFEMLTGQLPHSGSTPMSLAYQSVHGDVPAPSTLVPGIPPALDDLVLRATARRPDQRLPNGASFLDYVRRVIPYVDGQQGGGAGTATAVYQGGYGNTPPPTPGYAATQVNRPQNTPDLDTYLETSDYDRASSSYGGQPGYDPAGYDDRSGYDDDYADSAQGPVYANARERSGHRARAAGLLEGRKRPPMWLLGAGAAVVVLILIIVAFSALLGGGGGGTHVPLVVGESKVDAEKDLKDAGFKIAYGKAANDDKIAADHVLSQDPDGSGTADSGDTVTLVLSLGPAKIAVPDLKGMSLADAQAALQQADLSYGGIENVYSDEVEKDQVVSTDPGAGAQVTANTSIKLKISNGKQVSQVPSDIIGKTYSEVQQELGALGLQVQLDSSSDSNASDATVVSSSPSPGGSVKPGDTVTVTVTAGNGSGWTKMPELHKGMSYQEAKQLLDQAGLEIDAKNLNWLSFNNRVRSFSPDAGTTLPRGTRVTVVFTS